MRAFRLLAPLCLPLLSLACSAAAPAPSAPAPDPELAPPEPSAPESASPPSRLSPPTKAFPALLDASKTSRWKPVDTDPQPGAGRDFLTEVVLLHRTAGCAPGDVALPPGVHPDVFAAYCARLHPKMEVFREQILAKAAPFFAGIRPKELPPAVVVPFGVGDLMWSLIAFPDALEHTLLPFEPAGDVRRFGSATKPVLKKGLAQVEEGLKLYLEGGWHYVRKMAAAHQAALPEQIVYELVALTVLDYEPLSLRYFVLERSGALHYLDDAEIEELLRARPPAETQAGAAPAGTPFANAELRFRQRGGGPVKVFRHITANLTDANLTSDPDHLTKDPSILAHLNEKGLVSMMSRAGAYLLWFPQFSEMRNYVTSHVVWMPSDSSGLPPSVAAAAGLEQETYGEFTRPLDLGYGKTLPPYAEELGQLFAKYPGRTLDFFFGYPDKDKHAHLVVTRRPALGE